MHTVATIISLLLEDEPDFDADEYMSTTSSEDDLKKSLLANGFEGTDFETGFRRTSDENGKSHKYTVWYGSELKRWYVRIAEGLPGRAAVMVWFYVDQWSEPDLFQFIARLKSMKLVDL